MVTLYTPQSALGGSMRSSTTIEFGLVHQLGHTHSVGFAIIVGKTPLYSADFTPLACTIAV
jgi:hypothetical protein